jgi:hypothetical protein
MAMRAIHAESTAPMRADPSVVEFDSASRRRPTGVMRRYITRIGGEHEAQLSALLCGLDKSARIGRFGHPASDACVQSYAKDAAAGAASMAGTRLDFDLDEIFANIAVPTGASLEIAAEPRGTPVPDGYSPRDTAPRNRTAGSASR